MNRFFIPITFAKLTITGSQMNKILYFSIIAISLFFLFFMHYHNNKSIEENAKESIRFNKHQVAINVEALERCTSL